MIKHAHVRCAFAPAAEFGCSKHDLSSHRGASCGAPAQGECVNEYACVCQSVQTRRCVSFRLSRSSSNNKELQFLWMTLKIKMVDQREPVQPDFPFQDQTSRLVTDTRCWHCNTWTRTASRWSLGQLGELEVQLLQHKMAAGIDKVIFCTQEDYWG